MTVTKEERTKLLDTIASMSVLEVVDFVKEIEEKFGVSAAAPVAMMAGPAAAASAPAEEKTEFKVVMTSFGANKIEVIKVIRAITGLGLKEAKEMVEGVPSTVKESVAKDEAAKIKEQLTKAGAVVEVK